jgi:hypothetical protein
MDAYSNLLLQVFHEEILTPLALSFALVIFLNGIVKKVKNTALWKISILLTLGLVLIIFWPHVWFMFYPEPCIQAAGPPTAPCHFSPWARIKLGLFSAMLGCLLALLSVKAWQFLGKRMLNPK